MQTPDQPRKRRADDCEGPHASRRRFVGGDDEGGPTPFQLKLEQTEDDRPLAELAVQQLKVEQSEDDHLPQTTSGNVTAPPPAAAAAGSSSQQDAADRQGATDGQDAGKQVLAAAKAWVVRRQPSVLFPKVMKKSMVDTPRSGFWLQAPIGLLRYYGTTKRLLRIHCDDCPRDPAAFRNVVGRTTNQWEVEYLPRNSSSSRRSGGSSGGASRGGGSASSRGGGGRSSRGGGSASSRGGGGRSSRGGGSASSRGGGGRSSRGGGSASSRGGGRSSRGGGASSRSGSRLGGGVGLSGGWRGFAIDQALQELDVVVFEVLDHDPAAGIEGTWCGAAAAAAAAAGADGPLPEQRKHMRAHIFRVADYEDMPPQQEREEEEEEQPLADMPATPALLPVAGGHRSRVRLEQPDFDAAVEAAPATATAAGQAAPNEAQAGVGAARGRVSPQAPDAALAEAAATAAGPGCHAAPAASTDSVVIVSDSSDAEAVAAPSPPPAAAAAPAAATASSSSVVIVADSADIDDGQEVQGALAPSPAQPAAAPAAVAAAATGPVDTAQPAVARGRGSLAAAAAAAGRPAALLPAGFGLAAFSSLPEAVLQLQQLLHVLGPAVQASLLGQLEAAAEALEGLPTTHERMLAFRTSYGFVQGWVRVGDACKAQRALTGLLERALE